MNLAGIPMAECIADCEQEARCDERPDGEETSRHGQDLHEESLGPGQVASEGPGDQELDLVGKSPRPSSGTEAVSPGLSVGRCGHDRRYLACAATGRETTTAEERITR